MPTLNQRLDSAGKYLVYKGITMGDKINASTVQTWLAEFHSLTLREVNEHFSAWYKNNIMTPSQEPDAR